MYSERVKIYSAQYLNLLMRIFRRKSLPLAWAVYFACLHAFVQAASCSNLACLEATCLRYADTVLYGSDAKRARSLAIV